MTTNTYTMMIKRFRGQAASILNAIAILVFSLLVQPVVAQDVCIPDDTGVPYLSGNPNWWDDTLPTPEYWPAIDDPRWRGSFLHTPVPAGAASAHVTFRTLRNPTDVYMAWVVSVDPLLDGVEELWLGLSPSGGGGGVDDTLIQIVPFSVPPVESTGVPLPAPANGSVLTRTGPGGLWGNLTEPSWLDDVRVVRQCYTASCNDGSWSVLMKIPLQAPPNGIDLSTSFDFWFGVRVSHPGDNIIEYSYPSALSVDNVLAATDTTGWQSARRDSSPTAPGCIQGITLASSDIGTVDSAGDCIPATTLSSGMKVDDGSGGPGTIVFCARPQNDGSAVSADDINATFRLANWGSTSRLTGTWDTINTPDCSLETSDPTRACNNTAIATGAKGAITYQWDLSMEQACSYDVSPHPVVGCTDSPTKDDHQCMLVELAGVPGVTFPISSVARNMNFVEASTFVRDAEISVPGPRDVFLYVHTNNMPPPSGSNFDPKPGPIGVAAASSDNVGPIDEPNQPFEPPADKPPLEKSVYDELRDSEPTYQVHAFHDTGKVVNLRGSNYKLLKPQTSFGYFVEHDGALNGWDHKLDGAQEIITGKYYKVGVPASGKAKVTTTIEAIDYKWSWSVHAGVNDPGSDLSALADGDVSTAVDVEYAFNGTFAAEIFLGHDSFSGKGGGPDIDVTHTSVNGKAYFLRNPNRVYVNAGLGSYTFSPGSSETGFNLGLGAQFNLWHAAALELGAKQHFVSASSTDLDFLTLHIGYRGRF